MRPRPITLAMAMLCAVHLHASAASFQPVDDGLRPVYERITAIEAEVKTLEATRDGLDSQADERSATEEKIKALQLEKQRLNGVVLQARKFASSPLVTY